MSVSLPRLILTPSGHADTAALFAVSAARVARAAELDVVVCVIGADRDVPSVEAIRTLRAATNHEVHRLDPSLMSAPALQRLLVTVAKDADLTLIVSGRSTAKSDPVASELRDVHAALAAPLVICADAEDDSFGRATFVRAVEESCEPLHRAALAPVAAVMSEDSGGRLAPALEQRTGLDVIAAPPRSAFEGRIRLTEDNLARLILHARTASPLPPPVHRSRPRGGVRAQIGVVIDRCFDLYDEESLVQLELSGARLVPISALDQRSQVPSDLDGLLIGDARIERHSSVLSSARKTRESLRRLVEAGVPTLACGGGLAYLSRGMRTISGSFHPLCGAIDAEAVAVQGELPSGHAEVEFKVETFFGPTGARVRGFVQRAWLLRGVGQAERSVYRTISGPPDDGVAQGRVLGIHLRPYWPSCDGAADRFVDRCVTFAALKDGADSSKLRGR